MNLNRIATLAAAECERQQVGFDRLVMLLKGYEIASLEAKAGPPTYWVTMAIAKIAEPKSEGKTRTTPVTFANGGSSCAPDSVKDATLRLFANLPTDSEGVDEWIKQFLWVHPFKDGNGRMGWILFNWLNGTLAYPNPLPNYFGE